jgi:methyl-accepting chemotaxis protein
MKVRSISVQSKFFLLISGIVLFWLLAGFLIFSLMHNLAHDQDTFRHIRSIPTNILRMQNAIQFFYIHDLPSESFQQDGTSEGIERFREGYLKCQQHLSNLKQDPIILKSPSIQQKLDRIAEFLARLDGSFETLVEKYRQRGWDGYGLSGLILEQAGQLQDRSGDMMLAEMRDLLKEVELYLVFPRANRLNMLEKKVMAFEQIMAVQPSNDIGQDGDILILKQLTGSIRSLIQLDHELGISRYEGLQNQIYRTIQVLQSESESLSSSFGTKTHSRLTHIHIGIAIVMILSAMLLGLVLRRFSRSLSLSLQSLTGSIRELVTGKTPESILIQGKNELSEISRLLNRLSKSLIEKTRFAAALAEGKEAGHLDSLGKEDSLANALIRMEKQISMAKAEDLRHQQSGEQRRWANEGVAKFGEILRIYSSEINILAEHVIQELVRYLEASAGGFYLVDDKETEPAMDLISSFAYDRKKYIQKRFSFGEGLIGTCAIEQDKTFLTNIPENYLDITSGLGESKPRSILVVPLKLENKTLGVIEIASFSILKEHEITFVEKLAESIASAVATVKMNMRTAQLLEQSQAQAREMAKQEETMRQHMDELKATQEKSALRESEISGILNAIHNSSLVAEYNMDEELISINDKYQVLLEVQATQLLGKKLHEILGIKKHTDNYKQFWEGIRNGSIISRTDKITTVTGQHFWLRQTFTPILNESGEPFKVLNIANDITETIKQQESLENQAHEIARKNIEMGSFSEAVDKALIKCVYSPAGLILAVNENFEDATGFTEKELVGKNNRSFLERAEKEQMDKIWDGILKDKAYHGVIRRTKPTGEEVWIMASFTPVKDENGNIYKIYLLGQDITEKKLKYQLLEEANHEIERLQQELKANK